MRSKIGGIILALVMLGFGGHMLIAPSEYADTSEVNTGGRRGAIKKLFVWVIDTIGPVPTGLILVAGGGLVGFATLRSGDHDESAEQQAE
jgi:hypothetical protein